MKIASCKKKKIFTTFHDSCSHNRTVSRHVSCVSINVEKSCPIVFLILAKQRMSTIRVKARKKKQAKTFVFKHSHSLVLSVIGLYLCTTPSDDDITFGCYQPNVPPKHRHAHLMRNLFKQIHAWAAFCKSLVYTVRKGIQLFLREKFF